VKFDYVKILLTVHAVDHYDGVWRVMMVDECMLPSCNGDGNRIQMYSIMIGLIVVDEDQAEVARRMLDGYASCDGRYGARGKRQSDDFSVIGSSNKKVFETL
jgi:hypothetical protein